MCCKRLQLQEHFNPHPHTEDDVCEIGRLAAPGRISIHILTQRMTGWLKIWVCLRNDFNPHPHTEDDCCIWYILFRNTAYIELDATLSS